MKLIVFSRFYFWLQLWRKIQRYTRAATGVITQHGGTCRLNNDQTEALKASLISVPVRNVTSRKCCRQEKTSELCPANAPEQGGRGSN